MLPSARARPLDTAEFNFHLPDELIAQEPPVERGASRLLVLHRDSGEIEHSAFVHLAEHLQSGDLLVLNNTKVFPARLLGRRLPGGGAVECLLLRQLPTPNDQIPRDDSRQVGMWDLGSGV